MGRGTAATWSTAVPYYLECEKPPRPPSTSNVPAEAPVAIEPAASSSQYVGDSSTSKKIALRMDTGQLHRRLSKFSRDYDIEAEHRLQTLGFQASSRRNSALRRALHALERQFLCHYVAEPPQWRMRLRRLGSDRTLPDFCVVGPVKSGTSDLAVNLLLHPNVMAPLVKEFWEPDPQLWRLYYPTRRQKARHARRHGLALTPYLAPALHFLEVAELLHKANPNAKVVIPLRDPAERLFSHWKWERLLCGKQVADNLPFLSTFHAYVDRSLAIFPDCPMFTRCGFRGLETSIYWRAVEFWIGCLGAQNVLVLDIDDYFVDRAQFLRVVHEFVGLPHLAPPPSTKRIYENQICVPSPDRESMTKLREFFQPHNERLWKVIGKAFPWQSGDSASAVRT